MAGTGKKSTSKVNKSAWIRALPVTMPAQDVIDKAKAQGIKLSIAQVYTTRSAAKKKSGAGMKPATSVRRAAGRPRRAARARGGDDQLAFRRLVLSIGLPKAEAYLHELRRSVGL